MLEKMDQKLSIVSLLRQSQRNGCILSCMGKRLFIKRERRSKPIDENVFTWVSDIDPNDINMDLSVKQNIKCIYKINSLVARSTTGLH